MVGGGLQPWKENHCPIKIDVLDHIPRKGLDGGHDPTWCLEAIKDVKEMICRTLEGSSLNIIAAGMGGGMGTGVGPFIAYISQELGALTIAVISSPFSFEGNFRMKMARMGM